VIKFLKALRIPEVTLMTGFFMIGAVFAITKLNTETIINLLVIGAACFFLIISIYAFNSFFGKKLDEKNERLADLKHLSHLGFLVTSIIALGISLILGFYLNPVIPIALLIVAVLWILYSLPVFGLKHIPFAGTALHFIAQIIHFNMVYFIFAPIGIYSLMLSLFFSFCFSGGHINHEVIDYEADKSSGIRTGAVLIGQNSAIWLSFILFTSGIILLLILYLTRYLESYVLAVIVAGYLVQLISFIIMRPLMAKKRNIIFRYRNIYRIVFFLEGLSLLIFRMYLL
jgi:4-hydroxybenzoate polyprenyltransferase